MSIEAFFHAVNCDRKELAMEHLKEMGGLEAIFKARCDVNMRMVEGFLHRCSALMSLKGEHEFVKAIFDYMPEGADEKGTLDWFYHKLNGMPISTGVFLVGIGRVDRMKESYLFTCPTEFLRDEDFEDIDSIMAEASKLGVEFEAPERKSYRDVFAEKLDFEIDPSGGCDHTATKKRKADDKKYKLDPTALMDMWNVTSARALRDPTELTIFLTGHPRVDEQIIAELKHRYPPDHVSHSLCKKCPDVQGYPEEGSDPTNDGERYVPITIRKAARKTCPLGVSH